MIPTSFLKFDFLCILYIYIYIVAEIYFILLFQPFELGKRTDATSLVSSKLPENLDSQHSDEDEDHAPPKPKKRRKIPKQKSSPRKEISKFCKFICYINIYHF